MAHPPSIRPPPAEPSAHGLRLARRNSGARRRREGGKVCGVWFVPKEMNHGFGAFCLDVRTLIMFVAN